VRKRRLPTIASALAVTSAVSLFTVLPITSAFAQYSATVVMSGLDNPRGLAFGPDGSLYVTEAGTGGSGTTITSGANSQVSYGATSAVSRLLNGVQSRVLTGAPSLSVTKDPGLPNNPNPNFVPGTEASGLQDIAFIGGQAYGLVGFGANPALRSNFTETGAQYFGNIVRLSLDGTNAIQNVVDISGKEITDNPDGNTGNGGIDSNPVSFIALPGGGFAVTDAGANTVWGVTAGGTVTSLTTLFPSPTPAGYPPNSVPPVYQGVPTGMVLGPDGSYYFTQLTGFPFPPGQANIYKYDPLTGMRTVAYSGFTNLLDLAFAPDGSLYALQLNTNGLAPGLLNPNLTPGSGILYKIGTDGNRTIIDNTNLTNPTALAIGQDGAIYVSNQGNSPGVGQVIRIAATAPEPGSLPLVAAGGLLSLVGLVKRRQSRAVK
jgi:hypothetical protein